MRLLYAGNADGRAGSAEAVAEPGPRTDSRTSFRQFLSLHRLSGHRRRDRDHRACAYRTFMMTSARGTANTLSELDRPNSYIGKTVPRPNLDRLMQGRGVYVSDIELPRMAHVVFLRSPHAHARIKDIDVSAAREMPGVIAVVTAQELSAV